MATTTTRLKHQPTKHSDYMKERAWLMLCSLLNDGYRVLWKTHDSKTQSMIRLQHSRTSRRLTLHVYLHRVLLTEGGKTLKEIT